MHCKSLWIKASAKHTHPVWWNRADVCWLCWMLQAGNGAWWSGEPLLGWDQYGQHHGSAGPGRVSPLPLVPLQQAGAQPIHPVRNCSLHLLRSLYQHWRGFETSYIISPERNKWHSCYSIFTHPDDVSFVFSSRKSSLIRTIALILK